MISAIIASTTTQVVLDRVGTSWTWYVIRGAGFAASGLMVLLMLSGIGQVTGWTYRIMEPIKAWAVHKALALAMGVAILTHIIFLLIDRYVTFTIPQLLVPFLSNYSNGTSLFGLAIGGLAMSFGIFALYAVTIIILSSLGLIDSRKRIWRWLHYLSYVAFILVFIHALLAGSDLKYGTFRFAWLGVLGIVLLAMIGRAMRAGTLRKSR